MPVTQVNSKRLEDLRVRPATVKLLEDDSGKKTLDVGLGGDFLAMTPQARAMKAKINQWDQVETKSFCAAREATNKTERQLWLGGNVCKAHA